MESCTYATNSTDGLVRCQANHWSRARGAGSDTDPRRRAGARAKITHDYQTIDVLVIRGVVSRQLPRLPWRRWDAYACSVSSRMYRAKRGSVNS
jgi:hypothetical protein